VENDYSPVENDNSPVENVVLPEEISNSTKNNGFSGEFEALKQRKNLTNPKIDIVRQKKHIVKFQSNGKF
jgi:hypothetical protein